VDRRHDVVALLNDFVAAGQASNCRVSDETRTRDHLDHNPIWAAPRRTFGDVSGACET
jgi:hypothetical protein